MEGLSTNHGPLSLLLDQRQLSSEENTQFPSCFLHGGGDKWGKEPIGAANGMTATALLPTSGAGGVLRRGQTADAPNQRESRAFNSGRCPLLTPSPQISLFGLARTAVDV